MEPKIVPPPPHVAKHRAELWLERSLFTSRWLMAPFYVGLVVALAVVLWVFVAELVHSLANVAHMDAEDAILMALALIDLSLAGNLILIVVFSGYENFVSKIDTGNSEDRPSWMGTVDFSGLKMKLIASITAISAIALLRAFMRIGEEGVDQTKLMWMVIIHLTFVVSGVLLATMDLLASKTDKH
jgi:uncharacterized protein (TIGR00645 family)